MTILQSFAPICGKKPCVLILGTMPGKISLTQHQYYAHPQNAFWKILSELLHFDAKIDYATRIELLKHAHIAVWDVLKFCVRKSSLDAHIETNSEVPNEIAQLLQAHRTIQRVCFNGGKAAQLFRRHITPQLPNDFRGIEYCLLPSTSPAHASMRYAEKLDAWRLILK
jgi:double-stranded uracil-DNA glycosylase